jgi:hypothetical protein
VPPAAATTYLSSGQIPEQEDESLQLGAVAVLLGLAAGALARTTGTPAVDADAEDCSNS